MSVSGSPLSPACAGGPTAVAALLLLEMDAATAQLGFAPSLRLSGLLHTVAGRVEVVVAVRDGGLVLQVDDDGMWVPTGTRTSGLANLDARADERGGSSSSPGRTARQQLHMQVPLAQDEPSRRWTRLGRVRHDDHGARCMARAVQPDRPEQHPAERAPTT